MANGKIRDLPRRQVPGLKIRTRDAVIQNSEKIEYSCICEIQNSRLRARDPETPFLSAEIPRLNLTLPRFIIFDRPLATPIRDFTFLRGSRCLDIAKSPLSDHIAQSGTLENIINDIN